MPRYFTNKDEYYKHKLVDNEEMKITVFLANLGSVPGKVFPSASASMGDDDEFTKAITDNNPSKTDVF